MHPGRPAVTARPAIATSRQDPIDKVILDAADKHFGVQLKAQQLAAIRSCYSGKDTIVSLPTGFGKSLCFQLMPFLNRRTAIVICPLLALAADQV